MQFSNAVAHCETGRYGEALGPIDLSDDENLQDQAKKQKIKTHADLVLEQRSAKHAALIAIFNQKWERLSLELARLPTYAKIKREPFWSVALTRMQNIFPIDENGKRVLPPCDDPLMIKLLKSSVADEDGSRIVDLLKPWSAFDFELQADACATSLAFANAIRPTLFGFIFKDGVVAFQQHSSASF